MTKKVLTPAAAMEIKRLYALEDEKGNKQHSQMDIAAMLGVSETTVFRVVHKRAAYMAIRELPTDEEAKESERRFVAAHPELFGAADKMAAEIKVVKELPKKIDAMLDEIRSPLDE